MSNYNPNQPPYGQYTQAPAAPPGYAPPPAAPPGYGPPQAAPPQGYAPPGPYGVPGAYNPPAAPPQGYAPPGYGSPQVPGMPPAQQGGMFGGLNQANSFESGSYFDIATEGPGTYLCEIVKVLAKQTQAKGPALIVELRVVGSENPRCPVGTTHGWVQTLSDRNIAFPNILAFLGAVAGFHSADEINARVKPNAEAMLEEAIQRGTLTGKRVVVSAHAHTTKKGQVITRIKFSPAQ